MNKSGPIIIIEDDIDDQAVLVEIFNELNYQNERIFFKDGEEALKYLIDSDVKPFIVLSDINMPKLNGIELREKVVNNEDLRLKSIPYLFFTTTAEQKHVIDAYSRSIQGFFYKSPQLREIEIYHAEDCRILAGVRVAELYQECAVDA